MIIKTVKELKEFLNNLPDDALIYEQLTKQGKHLEAVDPVVHHESDIFEQSEDFYGPGYNVTTYYDFPEFIQVPITTVSVLDYLKKNI